MLSVDKIGASNSGYKLKLTNKSDVSFMSGNFASAPRKAQGVVEKLVKKTSLAVADSFVAVSNVDTILLNNLNIGASRKSYEQIMQEIGEVNKAVKDGNNVKLKKMVDKHYAKNTGEMPRLAKADEEASRSVKEAIRYLKIEKDSYKKVALDIEEKLNELEAQKAKLLEQSRQAQKITQKREKIEQFLNPETYNQKEIAQAEREIALSPEKQKELTDARQELIDLKILNNVLLKTRDAESENFSKNVKATAALKLRVQALEDSLTPKVLMQKELIAAQKEFRDLRTENKLLRKNKDLEPENFSKNIEAMEKLQLKIRTLKNSLTPDALKQKEISLVENGIVIPSEKQKELTDSQNKLNDLKVLHGLLSKQKDAAQEKFSQNIKEIAEQKLKIVALENSKTITPEALKKKEILLAQRQALIDFNAKTVEELEKDAKPWAQAMLKAMTPEGGIDAKDKVTGNDLLKLKLEAFKAEEAKTASVDSQISSINLDILEFSKEHKAFTANIEQLERRIEVLGFKKDKAARGIKETVGAPVSLPKKKKNQTNIDKQKRHMSLAEKRAASLARKEKRKELRAEIDKKVKEKIATNNAKIQEMSKELQLLEKEIADKETIIAAYRTEIALKNRESKFHNAEKARKSNLGILKSLANEVVTVPTTSSVQAVDLKPIRDDFSSEKEFKNAVRKFIRKQNRIKTQSERATKSGNKSNIRIKRNEIAESANELPSIKILAKVIEKVKKFLSAESFNQKELSLVELDALPEKKLALQEAKAKLEVLKQENEILKPFTGYIKQEKGKTAFVKFDSDVKMAEFIKREPKEQQFTTEKAFKKNLENWQARKTELESKKAKAEVFYKNEKEIKQYEDLIVQLESEQTLTPKAIKLREILLKQRKSVVDFNNTKLKDIEHNPLKNSIISDLPSEYRQFVNPEVMTGRNLLNLRLGELEAKREALIESEKETWYLSTLASKLTSDKDLLKKQKMILEGHIKEIENENLSIVKQTESMKKKVKI